jgi:hypothetical protein
VNSLLNLLTYLVFILRRCKQRSLHRRMEGWVMNCKGYRRKQSQPVLSTVPGSACKNREKSRKTSVRVVVTLMPLQICTHNHGHEICWSANLFFYYLCVATDIHRVLDGKFIFLISENRVTCTIYDMAGREYIYGLYLWHNFRFWLGELVVQLWYISFRYFATNE